MLVDSGNPGLEDLVPMGMHKVAEPSGRWLRGSFLAVTGNGRIPPNLISEATNRSDLSLGIILKKFPTGMRDFGFYGVRKILSV